MSQRRFDASVPACVGPLAPPRAPAWPVPRGAWDTHFHVLGPTHSFPYDPGRKYTPPDAPLQACWAMHEALGIDRGFVVHANVHGFDNSVDLDAVQRSHGRYLGVVRLDASTSKAQCRQLHARGVRGVRFAFNPAHGGALDLNVFNHVLACIKDFDWFDDLHFAGSMLPDLADWIRSVPAQVVIDHFGRVDPADGLDQPPVRALLALAEVPNIWVKLTGADRISREGAPYTDVLPLAQRLVHVGEDRLLWGSDWPHTGYFEQERLPDPAELLDALARMVPDATQRHRVLVTNPLALVERCGGDWRAAPKAD